LTAAGDLKHGPAMIKARNDIFGICREIICALKARTGPFIL